MSDDEIRELRELSALATAGPWKAGLAGGTVDAIHPVKNDADGTTVLVFASGYFGRREQEANVQLIAAARTAVPTLLDELEAAQSRVRVLEAKIAKVPHLAPLGDDRHAYLTGAHVLRSGDADVSEAKACARLGGKCAFEGE